MTDVAVEHVVSDAVSKVMHLSLSCPTTPSTGFGRGMGGDLFIQSCPRGGAFDDARRTLWPWSVY